MSERTKSKCWHLAEMLPAELETQIAAKPIVVLPFGTLEWHSYHLPIGLDSLKVEALGEQVAERTGAILAPTNYWAVGGVPFPYTLRFDLDLVETLARQLFQQMGVFGFRVILAQTGHYGLEQLVAVKRAAVATMRTSNLTIFAGAEYEMVTDLGYHGDHAAKWETSLLAATHPDLVRMHAIEPGRPLDGILGEDPRPSASTQLGEETIAEIVARLAAWAERSLELSGVARSQYIEAVAAGVRVLERLLTERQVKPKSQVPPVVTPAYLSFLQALYSGDYGAAIHHAETKWVDLGA